MNIEPNDQKQSISDDQELAKVLAGINSDASGGGQVAAPVDDTAGLPTPVAPLPAEPAASPAVDQAAPAVEDTPNLPTPTEPAVPELPSVEPVDAPSPAPVVDSALEAVKKQALGELRPLVDKLNVEADEKFDIYLLLLRSTDDRDLIAPAHEAALAIVDESKRAQALLDVIKEIDFLSQNQS